ncbi:hypothetical protein AVEN_155737-1 [Araneus ventricosus]|uniref:Integrase zinc-binding domain-containing protein n=1 Tax=Araneus ventricosus TaxID=182803 RepID=A0A4Y2RBF3_ARAVE|nr:hypothetical protein AVEN_155737-1 [Araneus ventricosus]
MYASHQTVPTDITLFSQQKKLKLADPYEKTDNLPIEVLIGADFYWPMMTIKPSKNLKESLVLMFYIFGWILSGEARKSKVQPLSFATFQPVINTSYFSSYNRLLRVTAWVLRFLNNCKSKHCLFQELTSDEIEKAKEYWILVVQQQCFPIEIKALEYSLPLPSKSEIARFNPFLQKNHLGLGGRLKFAPVTSEEKHSLLLDNYRNFAQLLIRHTHVRLHHLGVRIVLSKLLSNYWILRGREAIKRVIHRCLPCRLSKAPRGTKIEAPLPADRVTPYIPFSTTGIDFVGPLYVRNSKSLVTA